MTDIYRGTRASRKPKNDPLYWFLGKLDELSVSLGACALIECLPEVHRDYLRVLQQELIQLSAEVQSPATPADTGADDPSGDGSVAAYTSTVDHMESLIDSLTNVLPPLTRFLLTVTCEDDARCQRARVITREAERHAIGYFQDHDPPLPIGPELLRFLNRLSDYLFTLGRFVSQNTQTGEIVSSKTLVTEFTERYFSV